MSAEVVVAVPGNDTSGDSDIVSFKAESDGMSAGSCWAVITDQTLPDATLQLEITPNNAAAGNCIDLILTISNEGNSVLQRNTPIDIKCTGIFASKRVYTRKAIEKGCSEKLVVEDFQLLERTGLVVISAVINGDENVAELLYSNNRAKNVEINLSPAFEVTTAIDKTIYLQEDEVVISGHASGEAGQNAKIEIVLINDGVRQVLSTTTDEDGNYSYSYKLLSRQTGHFSVGACYPTSTPTNFVAFDVYGLQLSSAFVTCEPGLGETVSGSFTISNPGNLSQSNLSIAYSSNTTNCEFDIEAPSTIAAGSSINVNFSLKGNSLSPGKDFEKIPLLITTAEGSKAIFTIYYYIQALHGKLHTSTPSISTTMLKDTPRDYPIVIRNIGKGESGIISFAMPSWVETATPREIPSLASGDSTTVVLRFKPTDEMKLNVLTKGKLGINCANGDGLSVSFGIMPVSEATGRVTIDVVDEFTFYTDEAPHVSNAKVVITHPTSKEVIAEGQTDNNGIFTAEMNEGWYTLTIEADHHDAYTENIIVSPGTELHKEVFMPYQAITYKWNVEETEIEDEYVFETTIDFDTRVPKPVIVISLPDEKPEPYSVIPVKITNKGLINAVNIEMSLEVSDGYTLEFLNDPTAEVLAPQQTLIFYAKLMPTESGSDVRAKDTRAKRECIWVISKVKYHELCQKYTGEQFVRMLKKYGKESCFTSGNGSSGGNGGSGGFGGSGSNGGDVGRPGCWGGSSYGSGEYVIDWSNPEKYCDRKSGDNPKDDDDVSEDEMPPVPEGEPEEAECDEEPIVKFLVRAVDGNKRYGLAADGESKLLIELDVSRSKLPKPECGDLENTEWRILSDVGGTLEYSDSWQKIIYKAPSEFNEDGSAFKNVILSFTYMYNGKSYTEYASFALIRVPVVFVHGLNSDSGSWKNMISYMEHSRNYSSKQISAVDYKSTHNDAFNVNYRKVWYHINKQLTYMRYSLGYEVSKVDVVGHSMGGLLTKKVIQIYGPSKIRKLITINTPHGGSQLGNFLLDGNVQYVKELPIVELNDLPNPIFKNKPDEYPHKGARCALNAVYWMFRPSSGDFDNGAVANLSVNCEAINLINKGSTSGVFCHAVTCNSNGLINIPITGAGIPANVTNVFGYMFSAFEYESSNHAFYELFNGDFSDGIVALESQEGGLSGASTRLFEGQGEVSHTSSCVNQDIQEHVKTLLLANTNSSLFSDGFNATPHLEYRMNQLNRVYEIYPPRRNQNSCVEGVRKSRASEVSSEIICEYDKKQGVVNVRIEGEEFYRYEVSAFIDEQPIYLGSEMPAVIEVPDKYVGKINILCEAYDVDGNYYEAGKELEVDRLDGIIPTSINFIEPEYIVFKDLSLSYGVECHWSDGTVSDIINFDLHSENADIVEVKEDGSVIGKKKGTTSLVACFGGLECKVPVKCYNYQDDSLDSSDTGDNSDAICSTVSLSFKQSAVMTRQAFRGNFTLNNGHQTGTIREFKLNLEVKDEDGVVATRREFEITPEKLAGFQGNLDFNSGWSLEPSHNGEASILFIPTKHAAPTEPKEYSFGGTFSYLDPYTGLTVTRTLNPVTLTVNPSPQLELTYFLQRDVLMIS